jgi:APA family basic amino acid/polyamine antiporter
LDGKQADLPRSYGLATGIFVVVASMIGVGILTSSGYTIRATESYSTLLILWTVGGVLAVCGALTLAELATAMPRVGGEYIFVRTGFGERIAFVYGWATLLVGFAGPTALIAHSAIAYLVQPFAVPDIAKPVGASILILFFAAVHCAGQKESAFFQDLTTAFKLLGLVALVLFGIAVGSGSFEHLRDGKSITEQSAGLLAVNLVYVMYSYSGWNAAVYLAGEIRDAPRLVPRAVILGTAGVTLLYLLLNLTYAYALPPTALRTAPLSDVEAIAELCARKLFGASVSGPVSVIIGFGILSSVSAYLLVGPRVSFAMARDRLFPALAGRVHPRWHTPAAAIQIQAAAALVLLWSSHILTGGIDAFGELLRYTGVGLTALLVLTVSSIFAIRRRPDYRPTFRIPLYPLPPLCFLSVSAWILVFSIREEPLAALVSLATLLLAFPMYSLTRRNR